MATETEAATLGGRIREARLKHGLSVADLASSLGVASRTVERWESGETDIPVSRLYEIAQEFKVRIETLIAPKRRG